MIVQSIKAILGEELAEQVESALQGKGKEGKDLDLVVGNDGSFVPAEKYSGVQNQAASGEKALAAAAQALQSLGGTGRVEQLPQDVLAVKQSMEARQQSYEKEKTALLKKTTLKAALTGQVHDPADIIDRLVLEEIEVDEKGGLQSGWEHQLSSLRQQKPYLFLEQKPSLPPTLQGAKPAQAMLPTQEANPQNKNDGPVFF